MPGPPDSGQDFNVTLKVTGPLTQQEFDDFKAALNTFVASNAAAIIAISLTPTPNP